ncbi:hypothetical protein KRZ98_06210 [Sphingobium sp. AS12]|uniref:hypothetical protein n=1 Tax=Sphingobium sp. AS12 TaxID=2849495 RepID=UPI001C315030|nr:hypothetical protein [Sphingobium sp. AS12]MBV2147883.1 hypothetical protein [Sphingobium sp. AS12]
MLPRLEAEEQLARVEATGLGTGSYDAESQRQKLGRLDEARLGETGQAAVRQPAAKASAEQLAVMGIGMRIMATPEGAVADGSGPEGMPHG